MGRKRYQIAAWDVLVALEDLKKSKGDLTITVGEVAERFNQLFGTRYSPSRIGAVLLKMGIQKVRTHRGYVVITDKSVEDKLMITHRRNGR